MRKSHAESSGGIAKAVRQVIARHSLRTKGLAPQLQTSHKRPRLCDDRRAVFGFPKFPERHWGVVLFQNIDEVAGTGSLREAHGIRRAFVGKIGAAATGVSAIAQLALD